MTETATGIVNKKTHEFVLKHVFKKVSKLNESEECYSNLEDVSGLIWKACIKRVNGNLGVYLYCDREKSEKEWSIDTEKKIRVIHPNGKSACKTGASRYGKENAWGWHEFMKWDTMSKDYLDNDQLKVEIRVRIIQTTGIYKPNVMSFDDEDISDVALVADGKKFHVSKSYLSKHSSYFKSMFFGGFEETNQSVMELGGVDAEDLQKYLEALYGEDVIDEMTVEKILILADMHETKILVGKCRKFLLGSSKNTLKKKLELAVGYNLDDLKEKCISEIKTIEDVRSVLPGRISEMDPSVMAILFEKTLDLV